MTDDLNPLAIAAKNRANEALLNEKPEGSYKGIYNKFKLWINRQGNCHVENGCYITRYNVDQYFLREVSTYSGSSGYLRKHVSALQWFVKHREYVGCSTQITVDNPDVRAALTTQKLKMKHRTGTTRKYVSDPHQGLQDSISMDDRRKVLTHVYSKRPDWGKASFSLTWGLNAGLRGASNRNLVFADLNFSYSYGS